VGSGSGLVNDLHNIQNRITARVARGTRILCQQQNNNPFLLSAITWPNIVRFQ